MEDRATPARSAARMALVTVAPDLDKLIAPDCREQIRGEIADIGGAEIFFIGRLDSANCIESVESFAFGNKSAVSALTQYARAGDVILHNHPSGKLEPSAADIDISSTLGERGVASYIINNDCTQARIVVKALERPKRRPLDIEAMARALSPGGALAEGLEGYEHRPSQVEMLRAVAEAFNEDGLAAIEAPTGTGKSMAYLVPAIAWAVRNGEKIVLSTHTINLQEQLFEKDLPLIRQALNVEFEAELMKGRGNYLSRRRADYLFRNPDIGDAGEKREQIDAIEAWVRTTVDGSRSDLGFEPDPDVWERVMSDADDCMRTKCPTYNKCFFYNARRRAARAQIVIANHSLLVADLAVRGETQNYTQSFVLPAYHRVIIDEAHHLEDVATEHFGGRVSRIGLVMLLRRLASPRTGEGLLRHLAATIHEGKYDLARELARDWMMQLAGPILELHRELNDAVEEAAERTAIGLDQLEGGPIDRAIEFRRRVTEEMLSSTFWSRDVRAPLLAVITAARPLLEAMRKLHEALEDAVAEETSDATAPLMELKAAAAKIERSVASIARFLGDEEGYCRWIEYRRTAPGRKPFVAYCSAPLSVAEEIRDRLLRRFRTVILTSATLTVERKFDYFLQQIGGGDSARLGLLGSTTLREGAPPAASVARRPMRELMLDSPFDFERQVYVGVPVNLPTPREPGYAAALSDFLASALRASRGRAFVLFTAYSLLNEVHSRIAPELEAEGYPCLKQGTTGRTLLTQAFRREVGSILFATSSFWEGVDVPGEALSCLALARLPFGIPTEPIQEARIEAMRARGEDPFSELIVPRAVIKFRQGFGRLIRRSDDRGAVLICDRRVATQGYGQKFLKSLPTSKVHVARAELVIEALEAFFADVAR